MADKQAIMMALKKAMGGESGKTISDTDRLMGMGGMANESGKTVSDMDKALLKMLMGDQGLPGGEAGAVARGNNAARRRASEDAMPTGQMRPKARPFMRGGKVQGYEDGGVAAPKKKSKNGCVMKGRGGNYKGIK